MIEVRVKPTRLLFFNEEDYYGIYGVEVNTEDLMREEELKVNKYGNISIKGYMHKLNLYEEYTVRIKPDSDGKYEGSYILESIKSKKPNTIEEQKTFLSSILTPFQIENIYEVYKEEDDILGLIETGMFDYKKIKGMGDKTFESIKEKIMNNMDMSEILSFCAKYDIKYNQIAKLVRELKNPMIVLDKINDNPYILTSIRGIGFKKADEIAKAIGYEMTSPIRIDSALRYIIGEETSSGHCWVSFKPLLNKALDLLNISKTYIEDRLLNGAEGIKVIDERYTTDKIYNAEKFVSQSIIQHKSRTKKLFSTEELDKFLDEYCERNEIELEENQRAFFHDWNENSILFLVGGGGCVDKDTEFFNGKEWKKISDYNEDDYVLQYNNDGSTELVKPLKYHKLSTDNLTLIKNETGSLNQCLSDEHNFVYKTNRGNIANKEFSEVKELHNKSKNGFYGKVITTFDYNGDGIDLSDNEIRLMVAVIADGYFPNKNGNKCIINIKKERKKLRLEKLLKLTNKEYNKKEKEDGYVVYTFDSSIRNKIYKDDWYNCNREQYKIITDEVLHWDGSKPEGRGGQFWTNSKDSADFIQFAFTAIGKRATVNKRSSRENYNDEYYVTISKNPSVSMKTKDGSPKLELIDYKTIDGYKYCFTLSSGMWVTRREGRISVTGNCGKTWLQTILLKLIDTKNLRTALLSPTGKASKVQSKYTGRQASTIHRKTGVFGEDEEATAEIYEDVIIVDETSMCDVFILSKLFRAIKNNQVRILFVGDDFQLPSVGVGNYLYDCIHSHCVKISTLKKVFRQDDGGILDIATKVRNGEKFLNDDEEGRIVHGKDCVMWLVDQDYVKDGVITNYKNTLKRFSQDDITILSPTNKGKLGTVALNKEIQKIANPPASNKKEKSFGKKDVVTYRVGDLVMNTINTYGVDTTNGGKADIFNGDTGRIIDIDDEGKIFIVKFDDINVKIKSNNVLNSLIHAWVTTIHKSQGSQYKVVIMIVDKSMKFQLNANLIYTGVTRAKQFLLLLGQAEAINHGISKFANMERRSFLQELLHTYNGYSNDLDEKFEKARMLKSEPKEELFEDKNTDSGELEYF